MKKKYFQWKRNIILDIQEVIPEIWCERVGVNHIDLSALPPLCFWKEPIKVQSDSPNGISETLGAGADKVNNWITMFTHHLVKRRLAEVKCLPRRRTEPLRLWWLVTTETSHTDGASPAVSLRTVRRSGHCRVEVGSVPHWELHWGRPEWTASEPEIPYNIQQPLPDTPVTLDRNME